MGKKKVSPDKWEFAYATNKRRAWNAPEGSGHPVGTEYHWYVLAHQNARKRWSLTENAQREQLIKILEDYVVQLKREKMMNPLKTLLQ